MDIYSKTHFNKAPVLTKGRTRFDLSHSILTTFNTGEFVPIFCEPVYPGETHSLRTSSLTRLETSLHQTMDNAYLETAFFFVPDRILWDNFDKFLGANDDPWTQSTVYKIPQIHMTGYSGSATLTPGSLLNHLMFPAATYGYGNANPCLSYSALPLRAVFSVWNNWYRDENYDSIVYFSTGNSNIHLQDSFLINGNNFYPAFQILHVNRFKDVFSTALPAPQKGQEVTFGLAGLAPLTIGDNSQLYNVGGPIRFGSPNDSNHGGSWIQGVIRNGDTSVSAAQGTIGTNGTGVSGSMVTGDMLSSTNLFADLGSSSLITINQLRLAISAQAIAERNARGGTRMKERIYAEWGVKCSDLELDRPEFLGGKRIPISMMEVLQTSETGVTVLGSDAGHSKTVDSSESFVRSFTQYGWILGFVYVRTSRSYSQGIDRRFRQETVYDLYDPMMDNIGELSILKSELYALDTSTSAKVDTANSVAGYQEAWYELKSRLNRFSGYFQPSISGTLDSWHYGDDYSDYPVISASWLKEGPEQVDRTIAVTSEAELSFQWSANLYFEYYATREMAKYSIPNTFGF